MYVRYVIFLGLVSSRRKFPTLPLRSSVSLVGSDKKVNDDRKYSFLGSLATFDAIV